VGALYAAESVQVMRVPNSSWQPHPYRALPQVRMLQVARLG